MPSTLTLTLVAPAPGVSHLAPLPTCTTPGTVSGMMLEIRPESPEFLETLRRLVGVSMIWRGARLLPTAGDSSCTTAEAASVTTTSVEADGDLELEVLADGAVGFDGEGAGFDGAEAFGVGQQAVGSGRKVGKCIGAGAVGGGGAAHAGVVVGEGNGSGGDGASGGIDGEAGHSPERRLGVQGEDTEKERNKTLESHKGTFIVSQCTAPILWNCKVETVIRSRFHPVRDAAIASGRGAAFRLACAVGRACRSAGVRYGRRAPGPRLCRSVADPGDEAASWPAADGCCGRWARSLCYCWRAPAGGGKRALFALAVVGANLVSETMKLFFHRLRPEPWFGYPLPSSL